MSDIPAKAVLAAEMRSAVGFASIGLAIFSGTCLVSWLGFRETADPRWLADAWVGFVLVLNVLLLLAMWRFARASPSDDEIDRSWRRPTLVFWPAIMLLAVTSPWMLMSGAPASAQALGLALIPWYLAISLLVSTAATPAPSWGLLAVAVSGAAFALAQNLPHAPIWALFLLSVGASMIALRGLARRTVLDAVTKRLAVEAAAADTRQALAVAAAERDAKARFIASASHDLRQPLATAQLWARIGLDATPGEARARAIDNAERAFASAITQLDSMLHHLRLEAGAEMARIRSVPLAPILQAAADAHGPAAQAAGLRIILAPCRQLVVADPVLLARALDNLIGNSIRHSGARRLLLGARASGERISIWAIDDGRGIAPTDRERLFEDYAQGSDAGPGGFGIGLASVRRLLQLMGGDAMFDPRWADGAAFQLWLPQAPPVPAAAQ